MRGGRTVTGRRAALRAATTLCVASAVSVGIASASWADTAATATAGQSAHRGAMHVLGPQTPTPVEVPAGAMGDGSLPDDLALPAESGVGTRIVYSKSLMRIWVVDEWGQVIKTHRVSGREGVPGPGVYTVWSKSLSTFAEHNPTIRWNYMVRFAKTPRGGNIGFHEIPTQCGSGSCWKVQTSDQLGQALSGGCVRQTTEDAIWIYEWAQVGTVVVVVD